MMASSNRSKRSCTPPKKDSKYQKALQRTNSRLSRCFLFFLHSSPKFLSSFILPSLILPLLLTLCSTYLSTWVMSLPGHTKGACFLCFIVLGGCGGCTDGRRYLFPLVISGFLFFWFCSIGNEEERR